MQDPTASCVEIVKNGSPDPISRDLPPIPQSLIAKPISDLGLSVRSYKALTRRGIKTIGELWDLTDTKLLSFKNLGITSLIDIRKALRLALQIPPIQASEASHETALTIASDDTKWTLPDVIVGRLDADIEALDLSVRARNVLSDLQITRIGQLVNCSKETLSYQSNCGRKTLNEIDLRLCEYLESGGQASFRIRKEIGALGTRALIDSLLSQLPDRSRGVIADRYGLWDGIVETLEDIGNKLCLTRERVRQIEAKGLKRIRHIVGPSMDEFIRLKMLRRMNVEEGILSEEELVEAFSDDCGFTEASSALDLIRDLRGGSRLLGKEFQEIDSGVYAANAEVGSRYKASVALIQGILADSRTPLNENRLWDQLLTRSSGGVIHSRRFVGRTLEVSPSFSRLSNGTIMTSQAISSRGGRVARLCEAVLSGLGKPAHVSDITRRIANLHESVGRLSEGTVRNVLFSRRELFVWVKNSTYGLASWGLKQPPSIKQRLVEILSEQAYPVAYWFLKEKTLEVCNCRETSVRMTLDLNPKVFRKFKDDQYGLTAKFKA